MPLPTLLKGKNIHSFHVPFQAKNLGKRVARHAKNLLLFYISVNLKSKAAGAAAKGFPAYCFCASFKRTQRECFFVLEL